MNDSRAAHHRARAERQPLGRVGHNSIVTDRTGQQWMTYTASTGRSPTWRCRPVSPCGRCCWTGWTGSTAGRSSVAAGPPIREPARSRPAACWIRSSTHQRRLEGVGRRPGRTAERPEEDPALRGADRLGGRVSTASAPVTYGCSGRTRARGGGSVGVAARYADARTTCGRWSTRRPGHSTSSSRPRHGEDTSAPIPTVPTVQLARLVVQVRGAQLTASTATRTWATRRVVGVKLPSQLSRATLASARPAPRGRQRGRGPLYTPHTTW